MDPGCFPRAIFLYLLGMRVEGRGTSEDLFEKNRETEDEMRFEELIAWQKARQLTKKVYGLTRKADFSRDFCLVSQIQRASVSIMSNIAEGHERDGSSEFYRFLHMAKASCAEVRSHLYVAFDADYLTTEEFNTL